MAELIDREKLIALFMNKVIGFDSAIELIESVPTIDASYIQVIRCADCKYYHEDFWGDIEGLPIPIIIAHQVCTKWGSGCKTIENGYCHFGELRSEE